MRVNRAPDVQPPYRPIFWNCQDIAVRLALLATEHDNTIPLIRRISNAVVAAKRDFCNTECKLLDFSLKSGTSIGISAFFPGAESAVRATNAVYDVVRLSQEQVAHADRNAWVSILETRFSRLRALQSKPISLVS